MTTVEPDIGVELKLTLTVIFAVDLVEYDDLSVVTPTESCCGLDEVTIKFTVVECVFPPPLAVTVIGYVPTAVLEPTVNPKTEVCTPVVKSKLAGVKVAVTPAGSVPVVSVNVVKPFEGASVSVVCPEVACTKESVDGLEEIVKSGVGGALILLYADNASILP